MVFLFQMADISPCVFAVVVVVGTSQGLWALGRDPCTAVDLEAASANGQRTSVRWQIYGLPQKKLPGKHRRQKMAATQTFLTYYHYLGRCNPILRIFFRWVGSTTNQYTIFKTTGLLASTGPKLTAITVIAMGWNFQVPNIPRDSR